MTSCLFLQPRTTLYFNRFLSLFFCPKGKWGVKKDKIKRLIDYSNQQNIVIMFFQGIFRILLSLSASHEFCPRHSWGTLEHSCTLYSRLFPQVKTGYTHIHLFKVGLFLLCIFCSTVGKGKKVCTCKNFSALRWGKLRVQEMYRTPWVPDNLDELNSLDCWKCPWLL